MSQYFGIAKLALILSTLAYQPALANVGEAFGFGSRGAALAGATAAHGFATNLDGFAAYSNPAGIATNTKGKIVFSYGLTWMEPKFLPINDVVIENEYTSDRLRSASEVDTSYKSTFGQSLGLSFRLLPEKWNLSAGITTFLPISQVAYMDTGETFIPEYVLYRARTQRPQIELGIGCKPSESFQIGIGLHIAYSLTSSATLFLQTDQNKSSSMRFQSSLKPKAAPSFGILFTPSGNTSFGSVLRLPVSSSNYITLNSSARVLGPLAALDFRFKSMSALYYDPMSVEFSWSTTHWPDSRFYVQLDYQFWSKFEAPIISIQEPQTDQGIIISPSQTPAPYYKDILIPKFAEEISFGTKILRFGYAYRPSILKHLPQGAGNYLDPPKHIATVGLGLEYTDFRIDFNIAYHQLVTQNIVKDPGDETGAGSGDIKIGAPGYNAGGKIFGGGISLTLAL